MTHETDRELLELAAKAAGIKLGWCSDGRSWLKWPSFQWRPLEDDGDAFRLAVRLGIKLELHPAWVYARAVIASQKWREIEEGWGNSGDPYAATRRAIVRAAAAIGRAMP